MSTNGDAMKFLLEVVVVPVSDDDRSKAFYTEKCGFKLEVDSPLRVWTRSLNGWVCVGVLAWFALASDTRLAMARGPSP